MGRSRTTIALGCAALALGASSGLAQAQSPSPGKTTVMTLPKGRATDVEYGYGAAWVQIGPKVIERVEPGKPRRRVKTLANIYDLTAGYGRVWVLSRVGDRSYVTPVTSKTARIVGKRRGTRVGRDLDTIRAGAGAVWAGGQFNLSRINPRTRKAATHVWPTTTTGATNLWFAVAGGSMWSFSDANLLQWGPSAKKAPGKRNWNLSLRSETKGIGSQWGPSIAYRGGGFYIAGENDEGTGFAVEQVTPGTGVVASTTIPAADAEFLGLVAGGGSLWVLYADVTGGGFSLARVSPDLRQVESYPVPQLGKAGNDIQLGQVFMTYGGGSLWITNGGRKLVRIVPS